MGLIIIPQFACEKNLSMTVSSRSIDYLLSLTYNMWIMGPEGRFLLNTHKKKGKNLTALFQIEATAYAL